MLQGEQAYSRRVPSTAMGGTPLAPPRNVPPFTARQRKVIVLIAAGACDKEIGWSLGITTATAQKHVSNLLRRLAAPNRAAAVAAISAALPS